MTSKWVRKVVAARDYRVEWRLISLRLVNEHVDDDAQFPPDYEAYHDAGRRMLRVAARTRAELGPLARTGNGDLGPCRTPQILHVDPPGGVAFFGPVISRLPHRIRPCSCGATSLGWLASADSPNSNAACANNLS